MNQKTKKKNRDNVITYLNNAFNLNITRLLKGDICSPFSCPITNTLKKCFPDKLVNTDIEYVIIGKQRYPFPEEIQQFIRDFDAGKYPELEEV